jgi:cysteine desulfurase
MHKDTVYLDYAAATPLDKEVLEVMLPYFNGAFYNPSADYSLARTVKQRFEAARSDVAYLLGAKAGEIVFTAGATEANNLAIKGVMEQYPKARCLISAVEHQSVLAPASGYNCQSVRVDHEGRIDLDDLKRKLTDDVVLVSIMYVNNEVGTVEPLKEAAAIIKDIRTERLNKQKPLPLILHSDACQAANYLDLHTARLGVDLMSLNGGKIYGPKQSGALYVRSGVRLKPQIDGGGQEMGLRSGTENVAGAIGFSISLSKAQTMRTAEAERLRNLRDYFISRLNIDFPRAVINGSIKFRIPNNLHVTFPDQDNERLLIKLDQLGIMAAAGSACSAAKQEPSHVLRAMGISDGDARSSLRLSLGRSTTKSDIDRTIDALKRIIS